MALDIRSTLQVYRQGMNAIIKVALSHPIDQWDAPACGTWTASDVVVHLRIVTDWYQDWLHRALADRSGPPFPLRELPRRSQEALDAARGDALVDAIDRWRLSADQLAARAIDAWDVPYGCPMGTTTTGRFLGWAAGEFHLHASDIAYSVNGAFEPEQPDLLLQAYVHGMEDRAGRTGLSRRQVKLVDRTDDPWAMVLELSGRSRPPAL